MKIRKKTIKSTWKKTVSLLTAAFLVLVQIPVPAYAQFKGGSYGGDEESALGNDIYSGGSQQGNSTGTSSNSESLAHGAPAQLVFTVSPGTSKQHFKFPVQPVVEMQDFAGNTITSDNSTIVTISIFNNPTGSAKLDGEKSVKVVNGVATFTDLKIQVPGEFYTLMASA
ncbi:MAG: hypothetical protein KC618_02620, partial [Candidatus Omnitrophica bacterium]|nr:hypothetical protein [Candidatus Omnitrophota bacterium]